MKSNETIKRIRGLTLIVGAAAFLPLGAQAMLTDHDTNSAEPQGIKVCKNLTGEQDRALAIRIGTHYTLGANGACDTANQSEATTIAGESGEQLRYLP